MSRETLFPRGSKWIIMDTEMNAKNGLKSMATAYLIWTDERYFSIESLQQGMPKRKVPRALFGNNFKRSMAREIATGYIGSSHALTLYS